MERSFRAFSKKCTRLCDCFVWNFLTIGCASFFGLASEYHIPKTQKARSDERAFLQCVVGVQAAAELDRGPAINQIMNPISGSKSTSKHQPTFPPVEEDEPIMDTNAQTLRMSRISPPIPVISIPILTSHASDRILKKRWFQPE